MMTTNFNCPTHGGDIELGIKEDCSVCLKEKLGRVEEKLGRSEEKLGSTVQRLGRVRRSGIRPLAELAKEAIKISNETGSTNHTNTPHEKATFKNMKIPPVDLPSSFWEFETAYRFPRTINGEPGVNAKTMQLFEVLTDALGMKDHIEWMLDVPIMDTAPDVSSITTNNKVLCGSFEGKKPPRTDTEHRAMFGSGTPVAGEAFEQLTLVSLNNNNACGVGLLGTLQEFQLISNEDVGDGALNLNDIIDCFQPSKTESKDVTPNKNKVIDDDPKKNFSQNTGQNFELKSTKPPPAKKQKKENIKKGRVYTLIEVNNIEREYYATETLAFGETEDENRRVIELLAAYILLCAKAHQEKPTKPIDVTSKDVKLLTRLVQTQSSKFWFRQIKLPSGINFRAQPNKAHKNFYAIRQLGYGESGASCFACAENAAPCVVKFFRNRNEPFHKVKEEAKVWEDLYGKIFPFVEAYKTPRPILVMPFLRVPCNFEERNWFLYSKSGDEKDCLLYRALQNLAGKRYIHEEVRWHHVGLFYRFPETTTQQGRMGKFLQGVSNITSYFAKGNCGGDSGNDEADVEPVAVFCDLIHAKPCDDAESRQEWIKKTFQAMKDRVGTVSDTPSVIDVGNN